MLTSAPLLAAGAGEGSFFTALPSVLCPLADCAAPVAFFDLSSAVWAAFLGPAPNNMAPSFMPLLVDAPDEVGRSPLIVPYNAGSRYFWCARRSGICVRY